ncbi:XylR family transcriptional regulator [Mangrovibacter phragmitis]|uniref:XylR family transcriptional regulator n=1 Tax=Mangrovibacter phragmitis TaxID=1691903 RepID=A0A1B7LA95_9ENTR|nr:DNA-binding transcriptional regulator [Mangrovibacter phragmitis]OAT79253.1 XylR family transcriptional regulator [Mangrovibacter phragmitis]
MSPKSSEESVATRVVLLFNANKTYDRQIIQGIGEFIKDAQCDWDIYIEEDFSTRQFERDIAFANAIIADFDDGNIRECIADCNLPVVGVGSSYHHSSCYPGTPYVATDNEGIVACALEHLRSKGIKNFAFYGLPEEAGKPWAYERAWAFHSLMAQSGQPVRYYAGFLTHCSRWHEAQQELKAWLMTLPKGTGVIAVTDARARHLLQVCEHCNIFVPEVLSVIGIDNEELTRYLSKISLSSVVQGARTMGFEAARLLSLLLNGHNINSVPTVVPPCGVIERQSTNYRVVNDPVVINALHFIHTHALKGINVDNVLDNLGISRTNLEKRFLAETSMTIHKTIQEERMRKAQEMLTTTSLAINKISELCCYRTKEYFDALFTKETGMTPENYRRQYYMY